jgi:hypothetical protein
MTFQELAFEFLRRVVNELHGRQFRYYDGVVRPHEILTAQARQNDVLKVLPKLTREFAQKIKPEFTCCQKLASPPQYIFQHFTAHDPISGLSIRCYRQFDVREGEFLYRFDAAFS